WCEPLPGMLKEIMFSPGASFASRIAWRKLPKPASLVLITKSWYAMTRIVKVQEFELPQSSVAVLRTVLVATGNIEPDGGTLTMVGVEPHTSAETEVEKFTVAPPEPCGNSATIMFVGQVMVGATVSRMVIVWLQILVFPHSSVATQIRLAEKVMPHSG